jgi:hypothetical protein
MQTMTLHTFPARVAAGFLALAGALAIGGSVGYTLKPSNVISPPGHTVYVTTGATQIDTCVFVRGHRAC